jgi:hypothetical protein
MRRDAFLIVFGDCIASHRIALVMFFLGVLCVYPPLGRVFRVTTAQNEMMDIWGSPFCLFFFSLRDGPRRASAGFWCVSSHLFSLLSLSLSRALALAFMLPSTRGFICVISILVRHGRISSSRVFWFHHFPHLRSILRGSARRPERAVFMYIKST